MRALAAVPITPEAYAPYGALVLARVDLAPRSANHGDAEAWDALAVLDNLRGTAARCTASLFRCRAHAVASFEVRVLERHPLSTQMFVPMRASRFLLVVARGGDTPDLATAAAFVVEGPCAITYAPGVWHHPMIALDEPADFVNVIFSDGTSADCEEVTVEVGALEVAVPPRGA
ncbi:MAG: ureidoglycolate lyase [Sandaracinaceae bacterium]